MDEQVPDQKRHDPFDDERWPFPRATAWVIWRSRERIAQLLSDIAESEGRVQVFDIFNEAMRRENVSGGPPEGGLLPFLEAQAELWEQLKRGRLVALGVKVGEATWSHIPGSAWFNLDYFPCLDGRSDSIGSNYSAVYHGVIVPRSSVLEIWPDIANAKGRSGRGRKAMICQDQIDEVVFELFEVYGDLSDDDPDWHTQGQVENATRAKLEKKFGKENVVRESTLRGYVKKAIIERENKKAGN
jgi:hypothetical protein